MTLTVGSLFSGIGGLDLGLERAGMNVIWQSEIDPYACCVLSKHWPEVVNHGNIKEINWQEVERPDVICGGYPCQPFSTAGKRRGEEDPRHLWPWVRTAISELRPRYAILENVRGHLSMGGLSVIGELASIGYDAEWRIVSAASVGANHRRDRVIIVAYPQSQCGNGLIDNARDSEQSESTTQFGDSGRSQAMADSDNARGGTSRSGTNRNGTQEVQEWQHEPQSWLSGCSTNVADTDSTPRQQQQERQVQESNIGGCSTGQGNLAYASSKRCMDTFSAIFPTNGRFPSFAEPAERGWWTTEPDMGRVAHGVPKRVDRLRGLGNAVVPQVAEVIGRLVISHAQHN
jgi:DNA (cytosine-5)-methyltransferase 1